jgi:AraC-like DNA-binding protein
MASHRSYIGAMLNAPFFRHVRRAASGPVADFARESWTVQAERCRTAVEAALPDECVELYFNLGPAGRHVSGSVAGGSLSPRAAWVTGPRARPLYVEKETRDCDIVGIRLHPWMTERVLGIPASELRDSLVDLDVFWRYAVRDIRGELQAKSEPAERLAIVERAVQTHASRRHGRADEIAALRLCLAGDADVRAPVGELAARYGMSHRRVIEIFDRTVGLKPKAYYRVRRLRRVLRLVHATPRPTWTAIAHGCGYFDQAHLINDFRRLTGISPAEYEATRSSVGRGFVPHQLA